MNGFSTALSFSTYSTYVQWMSSNAALLPVFLVEKCFGLFA